MSKTVAIIGAGVSGLAAAKAALECGLKPSVFESRSRIGGLWDAQDGFVWNDMKTNLSKWTCAFSDFPWSKEAPDFPSSRDLPRYLNQYALHFGLDPHIHYEQSVTSVQPIRDQWEIITQQGKSGCYDGVFVASGVFAKPYFPFSKNEESTHTPYIHSGQYKTSSQLQGDDIVVIGSSLSGVEIAAHLADAGKHVTLIFNHPVWVLPRTMPSFTGNGTAPLDLVLNRRQVATNSQPTSFAEANLKKATFFQSTFGNPGNIHPSLYTPVSEEPPFVAISDTFLTHVQQGNIVPLHDRFQSLSERDLTTKQGKNVRGDAVIFCTGYEADLSFLPKPIQDKLNYDPYNKFMPFVADHSVMHPSLPNLAFIGLYRGPYFGVIELQARWAAMVLAGLDVEKPSLAGVHSELVIKNLRPSPQFPHGNYISFADSLAKKIKAFPASKDDLTNRLLSDCPVIPAHYRLTGYMKKPDIALSAMRSACHRVGLNYD